METVRIVLLHFGIAVAMAGAFGAAGLASKFAARIKARADRESLRRRSRETLYWRALAALPTATDE